MKKFRISLFAALTVTLLLSSCSQRLVDFTVISSKNTNLDFDKSKGKRTEGKSMQVLLIGVNIKDAMDNALQNAGPNYDMLIDGVVRSQTYPFYGGYIVEGTAVSSRDLRASLGKEGYENFAATHNIFVPETAEVIPAGE